jgi:hypothetical protein
MILRGIIINNCECVFNKYVLNGKYKNGPFSYRREPTFPEHLNPKSTDLIRKRLEVDPSKRLGGPAGSPLDIKRRPFFGVS